MKRNWIVALSTLVTSCLGSAALAQAPMGVQPVQPAQPASSNQQVVTFSSNPGCGVHGCPTCPTDSCCDGPGGALEAGVSLYYLKPRWSANPSGASLVDVPGGPTTIVQQNFSYPMSATPALWVGYTSDSGIGGRLRWFRFDQNTSRSFVNGVPPVLGVSATPLFVGPTVTTATDDLARAYSSLRIETWDLEATGTSGDERTLMQAGIGVRFAHLAQRYDAAVASVGAPTQSLFSGHNFNGGGPMVSGQYHRRLGDTGFGVFAIGRGALMWGNRKDNAFLLSDSALVLTGTATGDMLLPTVELELGVEYSRDIGDLQVFAQLGGVGQVYFNAGNSSNNNMITVPQNESNLGLFGLVISAGVRY